MVYSDDAMTVAAVVVISNTGSTRVVSSNIETAALEVGINGTLPGIVLLQKLQRRRAVLRLSSFLILFLIEKFQNILSAEETSDAEHGKASIIELDVFLPSNKGCLLWSVHFW